MSRLLTKDEARDYCGGVDPHKIAPPRRFGRAVRWDREEIDAALDAAWKQPDAPESGGSEHGFAELDKRLKGAPVRAT